MIRRWLRRRRLLREAEALEREARAARRAPRNVLLRASPALGVVGALAALSARVFEATQPAGATRDVAAALRQALLERDSARAAALEAAARHKREEARDHAARPTQRR